MTTIPSTPILGEQKPTTSPLEAAGWSEVGIYHPKNEDSFSIHPDQNQLQFCGVADGVGGGSFGDVASNTLIRYCQDLQLDTLQDNQKLSAWFLQSDQLIAQTLAKISNKPGASTFVGVWFVKPNQVKIIHVGDCRLYRINQQWQIEQVTQDQTYGNLGITPPKGGSTDDPARMVGVNAIGQVCITELTLNNHDQLLLCCDGLHKFIPDPNILATIQQAQTEQKSLQQTCQQLVQQAKQNKSHDDVTAVLIRYQAKRHYKIWIGITFLLLLIGALLFSLN